MIVLLSIAIHLTIWLLIGEITWYLSFCIWLFHLENVFRIHSLEQVSTLHSFLNWTMFHCVGIPHVLHSSLMDTWVVSASLLLWIMLLWTWMYQYLFKFLFSYSEYIITAFCYTFPLRSLLWNLCSSCLCILKICNQLSDLLMEIPVFHTKFESLLHPTTVH